MGWLATIGLAIIGGLSELAVGLLKDERHFLLPVGVVILSIAPLSVEKEMWEHKH
jgi:hypothetical protein